MVILLCFYFFYILLTRHPPSGMEGDRGYAGAHSAQAGTYKGAAVPTLRATTTNLDKVLT